MKTIKNYIACLTVLALLFTSCSKEDPIANDPEGEMATLSFATVLNNMVNKNALLKQQLDIPSCSDAAPAFVEVVLTGATNVGSTDSPLVVEVNPNPGDYDEDGEDEYFTRESGDLQLSPGTYSLDYFVVYDGDPADASSNRLWVAPSTGGDLANFVDNPLPVSFDLSVGAKKYVDVEVLCFDDRMVNDYGYQFFDIEDNRAIEFCVFGNFCPPSGRHFPAHFSMDVWSFENGERGELLHQGLTNEVELDENGDWAGTTVCMALPDTDGTDEYYFEVTLLDTPDDAYGDVENRIIRNGVMTDDEVRALFDGDNNLDYLHFREGCGGDDEPPVFDDPENDAITYKSCFMPVDGSQAFGFAYLRVKGDQMDAWIAAFNLEPGTKSIQNIYSGENGGAAACPPSASDELVMALFGDGGEYPVVSNDVPFTWEKTYTLGQDGVPTWEELSALDDNTIVFKGATENGEWNPDATVACGDFFTFDF